MHSRESSFLFLRLVPVLQKFYRKKIRVVLLVQIFLKNLRLVPVVRDLLIKIATFFVKMSHINRTVFEIFQQLWKNWTSRTTLKISNYPDYSLVSETVIPADSGPKWTVQKGESGRSWAKLKGHLSQTRRSMTIIDGLLSQTGRSFEPRPSRLDLFDRPV